MGRGMEQILYYAAGFVGLIIIIMIISRVSKSGRKSAGGAFGMSSGGGALGGMRGKTKEQKKVIKYFLSTGLLGAIFKISNEEFEAIMGQKVQWFRSQIHARALQVHGMDDDEVKEIPPIYIGDYNIRSRFRKIFKDLRFRASGYQMSYLLFSDKQMYAYKYNFDLTCADTTEQTKEYFYCDITDVEVIHEGVELPDPRPLKYKLGGIGAILLGVILMLAFMRSPGVGIFFLLCGIVAGIILLCFLGFTRTVYHNLVLRLTVPGDVYECAMNAENIPAIQGMKAKLREKKL